MVNSREKGKRFELKLAHIFQNYGFDARRGQQYCGSNGDADVVGLPGIHIEAKAVEKLNLYDALAQAKRDARENEIPAVFHKKNYCNVLVTMELDDWMRIYSDYDADAYCQDNSPDT